MTFFAIEKGVVLPVASKARTSFRIALESMEVGDSMCVPKCSDGTIYQMKPKKFAFRIQPDRSYRIWRIA